MEIDLVLEILRVVAKMVLQADSIDKGREMQKGEIRKKLWKLITESSLKSEISALMSHPCF